MFVELLNPSVFALLLTGQTRHCSVLLSNILPILLTLFGEMVK